MEPKVDLSPAPEGKGEGEEVFITVSDARSTFSPPVRILHALP
jgi:hypothetical protein